MAGELSMRGLMIGTPIPHYRPRVMPEPIPAGFSNLEWKLYRELTRRHIHFTMQVDFGGGQGFSGGMRVDFILPDRNLVIRVMGYWHTLSGAQDRDFLGRAYLEGLGYRVLDLTATDIETNLEGLLNQELGMPVPM